MIELRDVRTCSCGANIWDCPVSPRDGRPSYLEHIVCPSCGADHSRYPPLSWRLRYALNRVRRMYRLHRRTAIEWGLGRKRRYAMGKTLSYGLMHYWRLPHEQPSFLQRLARARAGQVNEQSNTPSAGNVHGEGRPAETG